MRAKPALAASDSATGSDVAGAVGAVGVAGAVDAAGAGAGADSWTPVGSEAGVDCASASNKVGSSAAAAAGGVVFGGAFFSAALVGGAFFAAFFAADGVAAPFAGALFFAAVVFFAVVAFFTGALFLAAGAFFAGVLFLAGAAFFAAGEAGEDSSAGDFSAGDVSAVDFSAGDACAGAAFLAASFVSSAAGVRDASSDGVSPEVGSVMSGRPLGSVWMVLIVSAASKQLEMFEPLVMFDAARGLRAVLLRADAESGHDVGVDGAQLVLDRPVCGLALLRRHRLGGVDGDGEIVEASGHGVDELLGVRRRVLRGYLLQ